MKWINVYGTLYKKPCALIVGTQNDLPLFGELQNLLTVNGKVYFHVQLFKTIHFNDHYHAYLVESSTDYRTVCHSELACHSPIHIRHLRVCQQGQKALVLKYHFSTL